MLTLPIKRKWYRMIMDPDPEKKKLEEYREVKPYYTKRFQTIGLLDQYGLPTIGQEWIRFRNGYSKDSPSMEALCSMDIKAGSEKWGAEPGVEYYALRILETREG